MSVTDSLTRWRPCWRLNDWNLPNQTYSNEPTKPNLPNHAYQTEPTKPNLPNYAYQNKPTKPNLLNKILWPEGRSFVRSCIFWSLAAMRLAARRWRVDWIGHSCRGEWKDQNTCLDSGLSEGCLCEDDPKKHRKCALYVYKVEDAGFLGRRYALYGKTFYLQNTLFLAPQVL